MPLRRRGDRIERHFGFIVPDPNDLSLHPGREFTIEPDKCYITYVRTPIEKDEWLLDYWKAIIHSAHGRVIQYFDIDSFDRAMQWFQMCLENPANWSKK